MWLHRIKWQVLHILLFSHSKENYNKVVKFSFSVFEQLLCKCDSCWSTLTLLCCYSCFHYLFWQVSPRRSFWGNHLYNWVLGPKVSGFCHHISIEPVKGKGNTLFYELNIKVILIISKLTQIHIITCPPHDM